MATNWKIAGLVVAAMSLVTSPAGATTYPDNRLVNPSAEAGLTGWQGTGFDVVGYATGVPRHPAPFVAAGIDWGLGASLFSASDDGAAISQVVDYSQLAATVDSGQQPLSIGGLFGGRGTGTGTRLVAQPLDGARAPIGAPYVVGNPTAQDRWFVDDAALWCHQVVPAVPVGTRGVLVTLQGRGVADALFAMPSVVLTPDHGAYSTANGCPAYRAPAPPPGISTSERRMPALRSLVVVPASNRCGRALPLRFSVNRGRRSQVARLRIGARGKTVTGSATKAFVIKGPRSGQLRVSIRLDLVDGRKLTSTQRFTACGFKRPAAKKPAAR